MMIPYLLLLLFEGVLSSPCCLPSESLQWLSPSSPPCLHPGQPILDLSPIRSLDCLPPSIHSDFVSLDGEGTLFAESRLCFYERPLVLRYNYSCGEERNERFLRIAHPLQSTRRVKRWVRRRNPASSAIHFEQEKYVKEVGEDVETGSSILSVHATHASGEALYYSMVAPQDSRSQNIFTLNTNTGEIHLAKSLDRETLDKHVLKVTAYERLNPSSSASTTIVIDVLDVQDNSPVFERDSYFAETREDAPVGTTVLSVFARDLDAGLNGEVEYFLDGKGEGADLLKVHPKLGVVQTAAQLDRETLPVMRLNVIARDKGIPPRESTALIELSLIDVNDNSPVFDQPQYNISVLENTTLPAVIAVVHAKDADAGLNGEVHYSLASSTSLPISVDYTTGEVTLRDALPLTDTAVSLLIRAKDGSQPARSTTVPLYIHVVDINDHEPRFVNTHKQLQVEEGIAVGEEIGRVLAIDEDLGANARIRYSLNGTDDFTIDGEMGILRTAKIIDRETTGKYDVVITATDGGDPLLSTAYQLSIVVKDVNDNAPLFDKNRTIVSLSEDSPRGTNVALLRAFDADEDPKITYRIEKSSEEVFSLIDMGLEGALLSLANPIKRAEKEVIEVIVSARDEGGLKGTTVVEIHVDDVNSPPVFLPQPFSVHLAEDAPIGSSVVIVKAEDNDRGENARIEYSCEDCDRDFTINATTGQITVAAPLDRETRNSYLLMVTASDHATPPLSTTTTMEIIIDDVNDNEPQFTSLNYSASISEDIAIGTSFLQVSARDADEGENSLLDYYLNESSSIVKEDLFRLDRTSGTLRVNARLDRETMPRIHLPIYARDRGKPSLSASSSITVNLMDVNDNAPRFEQSSYELNLEENAPPGTLVGTISATDEDEGENAKIEFRIFGGSDARYFDIVVDEMEANSVKILSRVPFDYEAKINTFYVEIQASSGQLSSTAGVRIRLLDVNDNQPQLRDFLVYVVSHEERLVHGEIGVIPAFDSDQSASLEYSLAENELLRVERNTGKLFLKTVWRNSLDASLDSCVTDGPNTVCAKCRLVHVYVKADWLSEAVTVRLEGTNEDSFWDPAVFNRFRQSISTLSDWTESDILPISVHKSRESELDVSFLVRHKQRVVKWWKLRDLLQSERRKIERFSLLRVEVFEAENCRKEPCPYMQQCRNTLKFMEEPYRHGTDNFISFALQTLKTFTCECPHGMTTSPSLSGSCNARIDLCYSNPCRNNGSCVPLESGYRCECIDRWRGAECEIPPLSHTCSPGYCRSDSRCILREGKMECTQCRYDEQDTDHRCSLRAISFDGKGAVRVEEQLGRVQWRAQFRVATIAHDGILLFAGDRNSDFVEISLEARLLKAEFSVGGETKGSIRMRDEKKNRMNDGEWHTVTVEYYERSLLVYLDECDPSLSGQENSRSCAMRVSIDLPEKCSDPSVPCFRFLDVVSGVFMGGRLSEGREIERALSGCISHLSIDGRDVDFGNRDETERMGVVHEGCAPRRERCREESCEGKCRERWKGVQCLPCHGRNCRDDEHPKLNTFSLFDEESYIVWKPSDSISSPFDLSFSFRSSKTYSQLLVVEFDVRVLFFTLHIEDGQLRASFGTNSTHLISPEIFPTHWTKVSLDFREDLIVIIIDGIYSTMIPLRQSLTLRSIYSGLAPSTNHPSQFEGCIKEMTVEDEILTPVAKGKTRPGCSTPNRCSIEGVCPPNSRCHREWERHSCHCQSGFFGDSCRSVCSLKGICGEGGLCQPTNTSRGYECECPSNRWGLNCEWSRPLRLCPSGWFGSFPHCKQCDCDPSKGFLSQCNLQSGQCTCPKGHFLSRGRCLPCGCGPSSLSSSCSSSGQCECAGDARGEKCDRCLSHFQVLDIKTGKCSPLKGSCPAQIEEGIGWPTTRKNSDSRVACPYPQTGVATRRCGSESLWKDVQKYNCTLPIFNDLLAKLSTAPLHEVIVQLANSTMDEPSLEGRNLLIARETLHRIIDSRNVSLVKQLVGDEELLNSLVSSSSSVFAHSRPLHLLSDLNRLLSFGRSLLSQHEDLLFPPPLLISTQNILFSLDDSSSRPFPKFESFFDLRPKDFPEAQLILSNGEKRKRLFYMITQPLSCLTCDSSIVGVHSSLSPIRIAFPLTTSSRWKYPECVQLKKGNWESEGSLLISVNSSFALCEFPSGEGLFTIVSSQQQSQLLRLSQLTPSYSIALVGTSLGLLLLSILLTLCRATIATRLIRVGFCLSLLVEAVVIFGMNKVVVNEVFCPVRNALLSLSTSSPFAWLFLYSLHIYRLMSEGVNHCNAFVSLLIGVVFPCIFSCASFFLSPSCSLHWSSWIFWILLSPVLLFLILSFYSSCTSLLLSGDKQYQMYVVGHKLKRALLQHAILCVMAVCYTTVGVFLSSHLGDYSELISNGLLLLISIATLLWSYTLSGRTSESGSPAYVGGKTLWVQNERKEEEEERCESPLMNVDGEERGRWMPDLIPGSSSTLDRPAPSILSPATHILTEAAPIYGNASSTLVRLATKEDFLDDAYYTYQRRYNSSTFSRT
ncbi:hypothetical protein PMAYCL1PPCAC_18043 [Pristionchus mayeri]|uniref:Uncharacterized protein n=1 Tax=Pristionchus mayeri TaxID=1317129 RepID=A0AAN5I119_9BILA|nr:hypothetical protein PMAYCL1PPCAC_18043 [Pristionchus mayeri]